VRLAVVDGPFINQTPIYAADDLFIVRFHVTPELWLPIEKAIPIKEDELWTSLSFTKGYDKGSSAWAQRVKGSLGIIADENATVILGALRRQRDANQTYPVDQEPYQRLITHVVRRADKDMTVTVPTAAIEAPVTVESPSEARESIRVQALLAEIGARMGLKVWLPRNDRAAILGEWQGNSDALLDRLPLNYDDVTLKTVERY
jgi:hypothetical protein